MEKERLAAIILSAAIVATAILLIFWLYLPHELTGWGIILAMLVIALAIYLDVKYIVASILEARRNASGIPGPRSKRGWLAILNYACATAIGVILVIFWFCLREQMGWGVRLALLLLLPICFINVYYFIFDFIDSGKTTS
ncbi:hypothetical protein [Methanocella sp. MCL-LM]|uniref:hypothetical protein n=1 Tax=Methanocella sp. MCL-LM TaxID=3412035 RepID=UPI003C764AF4